MEYYLRRHSRCTTFLVDRPSKRSGNSSDFSVLDGDRRRFFNLREIVNTNNQQLYNGNGKAFENKTIQLFPYFKYVV